jgi:holin-like protein
LHDLSVQALGAGPLRERSGVIARRLASWPDSVGWTHTTTTLQGGPTLIHGLLQLLLFQALGEVISAFVIPFIPGPVVGLVLLLAFLGWRGRVPPSMELVGSGILQHLGLLFVPASVGVVMFWPLLKENALAVSAALLLSVVATIFVTALVLKRLAPPAAQDEHAP